MQCAIDVPDSQRLSHAENRLFGSEKQAFKKAKKPVNGPEMAQNREKVLLGIYTHGRQKASKLAVFRGVSFQSDRTGQNWTNYDKTGQNWTILDNL